MSTLGRRLPYIIALGLIFPPTLWLVSFFNASYAASIATGSPDETFAIATIAASMAGLLSLNFMFLLRLRNAGHSGWWSLAGLIPYFGAALIGLAVFLPETGEALD